VTGKLLTEKNHGGSLLRKWLQDLFHRKVALGYE
jgi:hypothetical protein